MATTVALMGAGGKMGCRITDQLRDADRYELRCVEPSKAGRERLAERGLSARPEHEAVSGADIVLLAVPDELIGSITADVVPELDAGTMVVLLDPAAAHADVLYDREDVTYFVAHPCHPSFFTADTGMADDDTDWFGGQGRDEQNIVCALHRGPESDYERGEAIARDIYAPVGDAHRVTTEQMAMLEPALVESLLGSCLYAIRDGYRRVVEAGVPEEAARDFLFGHFRIEFGIVFGLTDFPFSDGAQAAIEQAREDIFTDDWEDEIFARDNVAQSAEEIVADD
ncbi:NADP oxidoreductase coenzyme F420-dependent [Halopelagius inordinatus]|uniref:NADP oxidoreductase coenzyme F420-dependent n=1 Tax=Halopelagius inordinatus TaxID=553467 RepID=A0A1I2SSF3_9EURY|nr:phosphogluconate dehydrogenase C-terminal domain-containing protein [Halopelagius inordinatus]SFG55608.1 NADP oxidoreductase coenzyme F420-dependent [Halopelagius inordinatus]